MKKKIFLLVTLIAVLACVLSALTACNVFKKDEPECDNVSRQTDAYFVGESAQFAVSIEKGKREKTFIADGKATDVVEFCQITITPLATNSYESVSFVIAGGETDSLSGVITTADYGEYSTTVELNFTPTSITVTAGGDVSEIELANILDGALSSADAVNIAREAFKDKLTQESEEGLSEREIYVKIITGDRLNYYYYVSFIGDGVDYLAMLIDPKTGNIVSKR